jgi:DNA polymerase I
MTPFRGNSSSQQHESWLFGWDPTPGIVSVWASRAGRALIWRRVGDQVVLEQKQYRPWLFATSPEDLAHLGSALQASADLWTETASFAYQELDGSPGDYRYLLSARDGRSLERALLRGAGRRLEREINSLNDLQNSYYRVGPVEQYLMSTGQVYFRGLTYEDLHRLQFDLETTALDPERGRIFLVAARDNRGFSRILEAPGPGDEAQLIAELCALIRERDPDIIENHNLLGFDLPFLQKRAALLRVPLHLGRPGGPQALESYEEPVSYGFYKRRRTRYSVAGRELIDTLDAVGRYDFVVRELPSYRLKDVARYFGLASPDRVYLEGAKVYETYRQEPDRVRRYALDDVQEVDGLSRRLMGASFALAGMAPRRYERIASAGPAMGILEPMLVRAYLSERAGLPYTPAEKYAGSEPHAGGAAYLLATGVAEHVVKADVASLYPSLIKIFRVAPARDHLGALLHILDRLTDLRLFHKAASRSAIPGSIEANQHDGTQAAMKTLINAAYGYMGAGSMALFADLDAANEVTRRGRDMLDHILEALRERGMALIEADTDGVYFAVPPDWSEEQERALVAEVGALLPTGIRLEYEGRYQAMLSHAVKNYALLTYGGQLIVRGVALRSSRVEPFGDRFLRQALHYVMRGDIVGVKRCYTETVEPLRRRLLPASDVATQVRLSKAPKEYLERRAKHAEAAYEALLAAGRSQWSVGERVRFYRVQGGGYVWLPEEADDAPLATSDPGDDGQLEVGVSFSSAAGAIEDRRDYDVEHYVRVLLTSYAERLRVAFDADDFDQLFRLGGQAGLFDRKIDEMQLRWIRCK